MVRLQFLCFDFFVVEDRHLIEIPDLKTLFRICLDLSVTSMPLLVWFVFHRSSTVYRGVQTSRDEVERGWIRTGCSQIEFSPTVYLYVMPTLVEPRRGSATLLNDWQHQVIQTTDHFPRRLFASYFHSFPSPFSHQTWSPNQPPSNRPSKTRESLPRSPLTMNC